MRRSPSLTLAFWLSFLISGATAIATRSSESAVDGKMLLQKYCSRCHSIDATGQSPLQLATPLR
jgi:cytochrome c553